MHIAIEYQIPQRYLKLVLAILEAFPLQRAVLKQGRAWEGYGMVHDGRAGTRMAWRNDACCVVDIQDI